MLSEGGVFCFNLMLTYAKGVSHSEDGKVYMRHYGQFTEIPYFYEFVAELQKSFSVLYETRRIYDDMYNFVCSRKPLPLVRVTK